MMAQNERTRSAPPPFMSVTSDMRIPRQRRTQDTGSTRHNTGGWNETERYLFLKGYRVFGHGQWKEIAAYVGTRSNVQVKTYCQKLLREKNASGSRATAKLKIIEELERAEAQENAPNSPDLSHLVWKRKRKEASAVSQHASSNKAVSEEHLASAALCSLKGAHESIERS